MNVYMTPDYGKDQFILANVVRAFGQPFTIVPVTALATATLARKDAGEGSAIFNMFRNLGGSFGIALLSTITQRREQFHDFRIGERVTRLRSGRAGTRRHRPGVFYQSRLRPGDCHGSSAQRLAVGRAEKCVCHGLQRRLSGGGGGIGHRGLRRLAVQKARSERTGRRVSGWSALLCRGGRVTLLPSCGQTFEQVSMYQPPLSRQALRIFCLHR